MVALTRLVAASTLALSALAASTNITAIIPYTNATIVVVSTRDLEPKIRYRIAINCRAACSYGKYRNSALCFGPCRKDEDDEREWFNKEQMRDYIHIVDPDLELWDCDRGCLCFLVMKMSYGPQFRFKAHKYANVWPIPETQMDVHREWLRYEYEDPYELQDW